MSILSSIRSIFTPSATKSGSTLDLLRESLYGFQSATGKNVNSTTALQVSAVFACCRVLGEGIAQIPLQLMQETGNKRNKAKDHPLYNLLGFAPNDFQTSFEYREMVVWHCVLTGNHLSFINRDSKGRILELLPFRPDQVTVKRDKQWGLTYEVRSDDDGSTKVFPKEAIWHVKGPSWNGWQGLECVKIARDAVGLAMATEEASARLHKNGVNTSGIYSVEGILSDEQQKSLSKWIQASYAGAENAGKAMVLDRGGKWLQTTMTSIDAQSLETRRFQIEEICRFARVSPIMVYGSDKSSTYAGSTANFLAHLVHTLSPWYQRLEQSMDMNLLTEKERAAGYYFNFVEEGLLRTSALETKDVILGYVNGGIMTPNEGRALLDMNPIDDGDSDELRIPANIVGEIPTEEPTKEPPKDTTAEDTVKALQLEMKSLRERPAPQPINVDARTTVTMPEMKHGDTHITLPEMKASDVNVQVDAPVTHVAAASPSITVEPSPVAVEYKAGNIIVQPADVNVHLPARKTDTIIERDANGAIIAAQQLERDV